MIFIAITFISISLAGLGLWLATASKKSSVATIAKPQAEEVDITNQVLHRYAQRAANK